MVKLTVFNMNEFLQIINECVGVVEVVDTDGQKRNITRQDELQWELRRRYHENRDFLKLTLEISNPKDYLNIVFFTVGDC